MTEFFKKQQEEQVGRAALVERATHSTEEGKSAGVLPLPLRVAQGQGQDDPSGMVQR